MINMSPKLLFLLYSRPLFRTCEIVCNHAARLLDSGRSLENKPVEVSILNNRRARYQRVLDRVSKSHGELCAECKGKCCGGQRDRDAFLDRVLQDPATISRSARNKISAEEYAKAGCSSESHGHCAQLTSTGCKIQYDRRPIQCTAYFCSPCINALTDSQCKLGTKALAALMGVQMQSVALAWSSRKSRS